MDAPIAQTQTGNILNLVMQTPKNRNALSLSMISELTNALERAKADKNLSVIILGATGPAFCAGHDLKEMTGARQSADGGKAFFAKTMEACSNLMQTIVKHPCPVIADVRGIATAAGCQLVASCDLALASDQSRFSTPGVQIGLFCSTPMVALSRNVSAKHAMEMLLTGEMISAQKAEQIGLINKSVPLEEMDRAVIDLATKIGSKSRMTLQTGKIAFYEQAQMKLADAYEYASNVMVENMMKNDANEGISAFLEKRKPEWTGN